MSIRGRVGLTVALLALVGAGAAQAGSLLETTLVAPELAKRTCLAPEAAARPGVVVRSVRAPRAGWVSARLHAAGGNWDLSVVDAKTGRIVAGSAHFGARELAEGVIDEATVLRVQACRLSGTASKARITLSVSKPPAPPKMDLVRVSTPTPEARETLVALGFDRTEHAGLDYTDIYLRKRTDAVKLGQAGLLSVTLTSDVASKERAARRVERAQQQVAVNGLPSGHTGTYRRLMDYTSEMNGLATTNPTLVKKFTLPLATYEGRPVEGVEITENVTARDGKPVFLIMGAHHAREWPSAEHTIEWAYELVSGYLGTGTYTVPSPRVVQLMQTVRTIVLPVVNPDGFNASREFGEIYGHGTGHDVLVTSDEVLAYLNEYRRKNCRVNEAPMPTGNCAGPAFGVGSTGVDLNRNYGTFWGGPGSSSDPTSEIFHGVHCTGDTPVKGPGCGPFSEPETEDVRRLVSARHVTTLITNHTFAELVLRAPGLKSQGLAPDEPAMKDLGDRMACENGYASQYGWQLYDTTGTTEDWSYEVTGGYGYTFEIGSDGGNFHTSFPVHVTAQYEGTSIAANAPANTCKADGLGNREAYFIAMENTANPVHHSVITGSAPAGAVLRLKKTLQTPTSIQNPDLSPKTFTDTLESTMVVPAGGAFTWHINPSTSPLALKDYGRDPHGVPSPPVTFTGMAGPANQPCSNDETTNANCYDDHPFTVPGGAGVDNATAAIRVEWSTPSSDWDIRVYRDANNDGLSAGETLLAKSESATTAAEATSVTEPDLVPGAYVVRVINYTAAEPYHGTVTFYGPVPHHPPTTESWTLTCEQPEGTVKSTFQLTIARGGQKTLTNLCTGAPTAVEVADFTARRTGNSVVLAWRTGSERQIAGFEVWRGATRVNRALIPAKRAAGGASYRFVDRAARAGRASTYRLRLIRPDGRRLWAGSASVRATR